MSGSHDCLYQINTRVWLNELSRLAGRPMTLDDVPDDTLDGWAAAGFDWIWLLSVWRTGPAGRAISRTHAPWRSEFLHTLPDCVDDDIQGSGFAIADYSLDPRLGGAESLARFRQRLRVRGLRLMLDFVPNHTALDHPWVAARPELYVQGDAPLLAREPRNYTRIGSGLSGSGLSGSGLRGSGRIGSAGGERVLAYGRDPYFEGWPDTAQLDYSQPATRQAMEGELLRVASQCDGLRCDMAMLVLPDVFERTWGRPTAPFWPAAIAKLRDRHPDFQLLAEVYWDREWDLLQQGFDYAYDKRLYDRLRDHTARDIRGHLAADIRFQRRLTRFLENHDEPRAAAVFARPRHEAAAVIAFLAPGLRFFHQGQLEGRRLRISPHLVRGPGEPVDGALARFYEQLLGALRDPTVRRGEWTLLDCGPAWEGNPSHDGFVAQLWHEPRGERITLAVANFAHDRGQCFARFPAAVGGKLRGRNWRLVDGVGPEIYERDGDDLADRGLYLDMPPMGRHVFRMHVPSQPSPLSASTCAHQQR